MTGILMMSVGNSYGSLPINTVAPVVSGTATVGSTLTTTNGTWTGAPAPTFTYQWQQNTTNIDGATSSTYVIQAADVGSTLRCVVTATNSVGAASANSNSTGTVPPVVGQVEYTSPGTYTWVAPAGVTSVSIVAVGKGGNGGVPAVNPGSGELTSGGGAGGGGLAYRNNTSVTPGTGYTITINSSESSFTTTCIGYAGGDANQYTAGSGGGGVGTAAFTGGNGRSGRSAPVWGYGGGGAAGYAGNGGRGGEAGVNGLPGAGGGGGGGTVSVETNPATLGGTGGGGVGLLGQGSNGAGAVVGANTGGGGGSGGSSGSSASNLNGTAGGGYGGGGGGGSSNGSSGSGGTGGPGAVRIIWPGTTRSFPSTNTGNL